jgi:hypothetical protein
MVAASLPFSARMAPCAGTSSRGTPPPPAAPLDRGPAPLLPPPRRSAHGRRSPVLALDHPLLRWAARGDYDRFDRFVRLGHARPSQVHDVRCKGPGVPAPGGHAARQPKAVQPAGVGTRTHVGRFKHRERARPVPVTPVVCRVLNIFKSSQPRPLRDVGKPAFFLLWQLL